MPPSNHDNERPWWKPVGNFLTYWLWTRWLPTPAEELPDEPAPRRRDIERGYESEPVNVQGIVLFSVLLVVMIVVTLITVVFLNNWFTAARPPAPETRFADVERVPPEPRLQQEPAVDMTELLRRETERLTSYGWADAGRTAAHIPIDRAMERIAARGLPYDTTAPADSMYRTITETGYVLERYAPRPLSAPPVRGGSPEPYVPSPEVLRELNLPDLQLPGWEERAVEQERQDPQP